MVKVFDNRAFAKVQQHYLFCRILQSMDPISQLQKELQNDESLLLQILDSQKIAQLKELVFNRIKKEVEKLQYVIRKGEQSQSVEEEIKRIITIQRKLYKNQSYLKQSGQYFGPIYLRVLVWSSKMALSEETLRLLSEFSFDKSLKLYYYYFKYYMSHLNLFYPDQIKIKHLFIPNPTLNFAFIRFAQAQNQNQSERLGNTHKFIISIPSLPRYLSQHGLSQNHGLNPYTAACLINKNYNLQLNEDDQIFHALMTKIKFILTKDRNSLVRAVMYSHWIFSFIDIAWLRAEGKLISMPDIFPLPPNYTKIQSELIQVFFQSRATPETHLAILTYIDNISALQQKIGQKDFYMSLNENIPLIIKLLEALNSQILNFSTNSSSDLQTQQKYESIIPLETIKNKEAIEKLSIVLSRQIVEATQLHNLAEELALTIYTKKTAIEVTDKTIQSCGLILIIVEADQEELLNFSIKEIKENKEKAYPYLKVINFLFEAKYIRQRRDFSVVARMIAQSEIFNLLKPIIEKEVQNNFLDLKSFVNAAMILMGNICSQNPTLVDLLANYEVLDILLHFLNRIERINNVECISNAINFLHYICLKQGEIRDKVLHGHVETFLRKILTSNLAQYITHKNFNLIWTSLHKFISNIQHSNVAVYSGLCYALKDLNNQCKNLPDIQTLIIQSKPINNEIYEIIQKINRFDSKLIILIKVIEKCKEVIFNKIGLSYIYIMYRRLAKLCFVRSNTLIDFPSQSKLLISLIQEMRILCGKIIERKKRNMEMEQEQIEIPEKQRQAELQNISSSDGDKDGLNQIAMISKTEVLKQFQEREYEQQESRENKNSKQLNFFNVKIRKLSTILKESFKDKDFKLSKSLRKFYQIFMQQPEITHQIYRQLQVALCFSYLDKIICYLNKELLTQVCQDQNSINILMDTQALLPYIIEIVTLANVENITNYIPNLKGIVSETQIITYRTQNNKIIFEQSLGKEIHLKLQQKWIYYHGIVENMMKCIPFMAENHREKFGYQFIQKVVVPLTEYTLQQITKIKNKNPKELALKDYEKIRYTLKIYLQLFCSIQHQTSETNILSPLNHIFMYYEYHAQKPIILQLLTDILNILTDSQLDMSSYLQDNVDNRFTMVKRIMVKMARNRAKAFIGNIFKYRENFIDNSQFYKTESKLYEGPYYYTLAKIYEDFGYMMTHMKLNESKSTVVLDDIRDEINSKFEKFLRQKNDFVQKMQHPLRIIHANRVLNKDEFDKKIKAQSQKMYTWILQNLSQKLTDSDFKLTKGLGTMLQTKQLQNIDLTTDRSRVSRKRLFEELCQQVLIISKKLFTSYTIAWNIPKKRNKNLLKSVLRRLEVEAQMGKQYSLKKQVRKLANICIIFTKQIDYSIQSNLFSPSDLQFTPNFVTELVKFVSEVIGNYEVAQGEDKYKQQANSLANVIINLLNTFEAYYFIHHENKIKLKKQKRKALNKNKNISRKSKTQRKRLKRIAKNLEFDKIQPQLHSPRKNATNIGLRRDQSLPDLAQPIHRLQTPRSHYKKKQKSSKTENKVKAKKKNKSMQKLSKAVQTLLANIFAASEVNPYLKSSTLHNALDYIIGQMPKRQLIQKPQNKKIIQIDMIQLIPILLRTRINEIKHEGYFHKLSKIGYQLISSTQGCVNRQIAIKRLFFEQNKREMPIREFAKYLNKIEQFEQAYPTHLSYLLQIKKPKNLPVKSKQKLKFKKLHLDFRDEQDKNQQQPQNEPSDKEKPDVQNKKNQDNQPQKPEIQQPQFQILQFNYENYRNLKVRKQVKVLLAPSVELNLINYNLQAHIAANTITPPNHQQPQQANVGSSAAKDKKQRERRSSQIYQEQEPKKHQPHVYEPIKTVDYVPTIVMQIFVHQIVSNIARLITRCMSQVELSSQSIQNVMQNQSKIQEEKTNESIIRNQAYVDVFNITVLIEVLHILIRECPCISPFITKYKCRKLIIQNMEGLGKRSRNILSQLLGLQTKKQIPLLGFLVRAVCPLFFNRIFTLVYQMCLDNIVIQKQKQSQTTQQQIPNIQPQNQMSQENNPQSNNLQILAQNPQVSNSVDNVNMQINTEQSFVTFAHVVRQRCLSEILEQLSAVGDNFMRRMSIINLITMLLSIREFSKLCLQTPNLLKNLQNMYVTTLNRIKAQNLPKMSIIAKRVLIPFYVNPLSLLLQINISLAMQKRQKRKPIKIFFRLTKQSIESQLIPSQFFHPTKFQNNWPYTTSNEINLGFNNQNLEQYESSQEENSDDENSFTDSQVDNEIQQMLENVLEQNSQIQLQDDHHLEGQHDLHTNSWLAHENISDQFMNIQEDEDDQDDDDDENGGQRNITINIYPREDDNIIENESSEEEQNDNEHLLLDSHQSPQDEELGQDSQISQSSQISEISENPQQDEQAPSRSDNPSSQLQIQLNSNSQDQYGQLQINSDNEEMEMNQYHFNSSRNRSMLGSYNDFDDIISLDRADGKNFIYRAEREQQATIKIFLALFSNKNNQFRKLKNKTEEEIMLEKKYQKKNVQHQSSNTIEDYNNCLLRVIDDPELIRYAENIEFKNFQMFEAFFWNTPPPMVLLQGSGTDNYGDGRDILGFDSNINARGRGRRNAMIRNSGLGGEQIFERINNGTIRISSTNLHPDLAREISRLQRVGIRQDQIPFEVHTYPRQQRESPPSAIRSASRMNATNIRIRADLSQQQSPVIYREHPQNQQSQNNELEEESNHDMENQYLENEQLEFFYSFGNQDENGRYMGMSLEEINTALQSQGFSIQNFMTFPQDIQQDILHNIREQIRLNRQFLSNRQNAEGNDNQNMVNEQRNEEIQDLAQPNTPILQVNEFGVNEEGGNLPNQLEQPRNQTSPEKIEEVSQQYRKYSNQHIKKINKDVIYLLNREGKNDSKFTQSSDEFLQAVLELIYILNENDHIYFPYNLIICLCVNSTNESKILSDLIGILMLGPGYKQVKGKLPYTSGVNNQGQYIDNYIKCGYPDIALKVLHMLMHLSKSYSISMSMMHIQNKTTANMNISGIEDMLNKNTLLQNLMNLLKHRHIKEEPLNLDCLLSIINNMTSIKFNYHIYNMITNKEKEKQKEKQKDKEKEKSKQLQKQKPDRSRDATLQLTQENNALLFSLLQSDFLKQNTHDISKIIMRLSIDQKNLNNFIHFFKKIIRGLAQKISKSLVEAFQKYGNDKSISHKPSYKQKLDRNYTEPVIVQLMTIFYDIIKSMKTSITTQDKHLNLLQQFRQILECQEIKELCEQGCNILVQNPSSPQIVPKIHQFIDCFFAIFNILQDKTENKEKEKQKDENTIALLGKPGQKIHAHKKTSIKRKFSSNYIDLETFFQKKICTPQGKAFINANIRNKLYSVLKGNRRYRQSLFQIPIIVVAIETPHMLEFDNKKSLFKAEIKRIKQKRSYETLHLVLDREDVFQQSFQEFMNRKSEELKGKLKIQFVGQEGEDVGGLTRQWFQLLSKQMFNPNYALFTPSSTGSTYQPSSRSWVNSDHLNYFRFIGRVMGKALHDGFMLDAYFTPAFYKHILSIPITYQDMEQQDFQYYKSLKWILENSPIEDYMQLYFTYEFDNFGQIKTQNLVPNGDKIQVTQENKLQYVQLISYAKMAKSVQKQYQNLLQGFHEFIPARIIKIFDQKELEIMISGLPTIDIEDLKKNTDLVNYNKTDQIIIWFFEVLESFDMSLRTAFLQFVTGTSRVPPQGFKALQGFNGPQKFNIHKNYDVKHLPRSHTCFNQLDLPSYQSKQMLIEKLTLAITEGKQGFGII